MSPTLSHCMTHQNCIRTLLNDPVRLGTALCEDGYERQSISMELLTVQGDEVPVTCHMKLASRVFLHQNRAVIPHSSSMATHLSRATPLKAPATLHNRAATLLHNRAPTHHSSSSHMATPHSSREGTTHHLSRSVKWAPFALQRHVGYSSCSI